MNRKLWIAAFVLLLAAAAFAQTEADFNVTWMQPHYTTL